MFSKLRPTLLYKNTSADISSHDNDVEGELWSYEGRDVYRGSFDPLYSEHNLNSYSLYDDNLKRVGIAEHEVESPEVFKVLWFYDNPFSTMFQDDSWTCKNATLWSLLSNEAYQDLLNEDFKNVDDKFMQEGILLVRPEMLGENEVYMYECEDCGNKSLSMPRVCKATKKVMDFLHYSLLFLDDSFVLYSAPKDFTWPGQRGACEPERSEQAESCPDPPECSDAAETPGELPPPQDSPPTHPHEQPLPERSQSPEHAPEATPEQPASST